MVGAAVFLLAVHSNPTRPALVHHYSGQRCRHCKLLEPPFCFALLFWTTATALSYCFCACLCGVAAVQDLDFSICDYLRKLITGTREKSSRSLIH
ncbi:hypothetical protein PIB30_022754 [Stylosanthes scabra]|uniref:Secreted protein n=1 Tax=Stylosanthes scabra TaxID=79078 RepID=A0ABU6Q8X2_9FABA|nr:hypothetical protein [Stylosanthes scabra]